MSEREAGELSFEASLQQLEALVARLEDGATPLDGLVEQYERGVLLLRTCERRLREAELRLEQIAPGAGGAVVTPFETARE